MVDTPSSRIHRLIKDSGLSMRSVATKTGVSVTTISQWCKGTYAPTGKNLDAFCDMFNVTQAWVLFGEGKDAGEDTDQKSVISVPLLNVEASCGGGSVVDDTGIVRMIRFNANYLRQRARGANPNALNIITVRGDSMAPTVDDGDAVVIDTSDTEVRQDGVYAVQLGGFLYVKRLQITPSGIRILSDNPHYPPIDVGEQDTLKIAGRCYTGISLRDL